MKNVCFLNTTPFWGGGEKLHLEYALKFREHGYNVCIAAGDNSPLHQKCIEYALPVFCITLKNLSFLDPFKRNRLRKFFLEKHIDTVIISNSPDMKAGGLAARSAGVHSVVYLRGLAIPVRNNFLNRYLFSQVITHIVANSEETKKTILKNLSAAIAESKVKVIYHGIDLKEFDHKYKKKLFQADDCTIIIGNAGRLTKQKGQHHLINIALKLKQRGTRFKLVIAGMGDLKEELERRIHENNLENEIMLAGFISDMESFMHSVDVFILPSEWEGFGYVLVEAMAAGKPVVAFDISSNPEIVVNNETGFLVRFPDTEAFATAIEKLIRDNHLAQSMGRAGRKRVEKLFELEERTSEFENHIRT